MWSSTPHRWMEHLLSLLFVNVSFLFTCKMLRAKRNCSMKAVPRAVASEWEGPLYASSLIDLSIWAPKKINSLMAHVTIIFQNSRKILSVLTTSVLYVIYWICAFAPWDELFCYLVVFIKIKEQSLIGTRWAFMSTFFISISHSLSYLAISVCTVGRHKWQRNENLHFENTLASFHYSPCLPLSRCIYLSLWLDFRKAENTSLP